MQEWYFSAIEFTRCWCNGSILAIVNTRHVEELCYSQSVPTPSCTRLGDREDREKQSSLVPLSGYLESCTGCRPIGTQFHIDWPDGKRRTQCRTEVWFQAPAAVDTVRQPVGSRKELVLDQSDYTLWLD
jgi:hypothetical protein